jgi:hypothetical protein
LRANRLRPRETNGDKIVVGRTSANGGIRPYLGTFPRRGYSSGRGYGSFGIVGVILIVVLILVLTGRV